MGFQKILRISIRIGIWVPRVLSGVLRFPQNNTSQAPNCASGDRMVFMPQKWTSLNNLYSRVHFSGSGRFDAENKVHGSQAENGKGSKCCTVVEKGGPRYGNLNLIETQGLAISSKITCLDSAENTWTTSERSC